MTTAITALGLSAGLPAAEDWLYVQAVDPALAEARRAAQAAYNVEERCWQRETATYQRNAGVIRRRLQSPHGRVLRQAAAVVDLCRDLGIRGVPCEI